MRELKGGSGKPATRKTPPKYDPADEYDPSKDAPKEPPKKEGPPRLIQIKSTARLQQIVPSQVLSMRAFRWQPQPFVPESERLQNEIKEAALQNRSLALFADDPTLPMIYCVSGTPDDSKARYFAAYLISMHLEKLRHRARVVWFPVYSGYDNPLLRDYGYYSDNDPTMIVLCNLTPNASSAKLDKCRDILERFPNIPRVVVVAGEDPFSFMATRMFSPINGVAYFSEKLIKQKIEIY